MDILNVSLFDVIIALSNIMDQVSPELSGHHKRVAYIAGAIAAETDMEEEERKNLFFAALLHDCGAISLTERLEALQFEVSQPERHAFLGYYLLKDFMLLEKAAEIIRYHHTYWNCGLPEPVSMQSRILHLADRIDIQIEKKEDILSQRSRIDDCIRKETGRMFAPELVDIYLRLSNKEAFWLDMIYPSSNTNNRFTYGDIRLDFQGVTEISMLMERLIDFRSRFTSTHSSGVAAVAEKLAWLYGMPEDECFAIKISGNLHDLGKLAVPVELLEKNDKLTDEEFNIVKCHTFYSYKVLDSIKGFEKIRDYACYHHEKLNGSGYPFHLKADELTTGARIMAVSDIFTPLTEDRPYRRGMESCEVKRLLGDMADRNELDRQLVELLSDNYVQVDAARKTAQAEAVHKYEELIKDTLKIA